MMLFRRHVDEHKPPLSPATIRLTQRLESVVAQLETVSAQLERQLEKERRAEDDQAQATD